MYVETLLNGWFISLCARNGINTYSALYTLTRTHTHMHMHTQLFSHHTLCPTPILLPVYSVTHSESGLLHPLSSVAVETQIINVCI